MVHDGGRQGVVGEKVRDDSLALLLLLHDIAVHYVVLRSGSNVSKVINE